MAEVFLLRPSLVARPLVGVLGVHRARCIKVAVRFLSLSHNVEHAVDILHETLVAVCLQRVACALDSLIHVGVVERQSAHLVRLARFGGLLKVGVSSCLLAFAESERYGHVAACLESLSPKRVSNLHLGKFHGSDRIAVATLLLCIGWHQHGSHDSSDNEFLHYL